ncbi:MAG: GGDEF domain-containing protein [Desulfobulbaceae bacterium]|nr:MAG: GGDEF domain-containing protein [Desulfobulbaceae bacterium]
MNDEATGIISQITATLASIGDSMLGWSTAKKLRLIIVVLMVIPTLGGLIILKVDAQYLESYLVFMLLAWLILLRPLSTLLGHFLALQELHDIEQFCRKFKSGNYGARFDLPPQRAEESDLLALKRHLNWMAHLISRRERQLEEELGKAHQDRAHHENMSMLDPLTGLHNQRGLQAKMTQLIIEATATNRPLTMIFIDIDKFKSVNDTFGHQAGDELLRHMGRILRDNVREDMDVPFRYGGDEFGVLLVNTELKHANVLGERILQTYNTAKTGDTTLSIGIIEMIATEGDHHLATDKMMKMADQAAYKAKRSGGNRIHTIPASVNRP